MLAMKYTVVPLIFHTPKKYKNSWVYEKLEVKKYNWFWGVWKIRGKKNQSILGVYEKLEVKKSCPFLGVWKIRIILEFFNTNI